MAPLNRRDLALSTLAALAPWPAAWAQSAPTPQEGVHYRRLRKALPATPGKVEVVEFFWYGCPHCDAFEPLIGAWKKTLPPAVSFRHVHIAFRENTRAHQRLFVTLDAMGVESKFRAAVFNAIHRQGNRLETPEQMTQLLGPLGLDVAKFQATYQSFGVGAYLNSANQLSDAYGVDMVPMVGVGGQFITAPSLATKGENVPESVSGQRCLALVDRLLQPLLKG